jgi:hypothetical protein
MTSALDLTLDEALLLCRACRPSGQILPFNDLEREALAQMAARLDEIVAAKRCGSKAEPKPTDWPPPIGEPPRPPYYTMGPKPEPKLSEEAEEVWYEVTDWAAKEADVELKVPHTTVRGPIENLMVVVLDREVLQDVGFERFVSHARNVRERAIEALRHAGWFGDVALVTSDVKLVRFKKVEV